MLFLFKSGFCIFHPKLLSHAVRIVHSEFIISAAGEDKTQAFPDVVEIVQKAAEGNGHAASYSQPILAHSLKVNDSKAGLR